MFKITTFGESHGAAVGVIVDGTPGVEISEAYIQNQMDRRKPGQSSVTLPRKEYDIVHILSGVFEGKMTGTPLFIILHNHDMRPAAYDEIQNYFRPGHVHFTYLQKYGIRDHRGSGRASGRETAARVAGGAGRASCWRKEEYRCWLVRKKPGESHAGPLMSKPSNKMPSVPVTRWQQPR